MNSAEFMDAHPGSKHGHILTTELATIWHNIQITFGEIGFVPTELAS